MIITTTDNYVKIKYGKDTFTHAINTISYAVNEESEGVTLFRNNEPIGTSPISKTTVNDEALTRDNIDTLLGDLFVCGSTGGGSGISLPIEISDVNGLQEKLDEAATEWTGLTYYVDGTYSGNDSTGSPLKPFRTIQQAHDAFEPVETWDTVKLVISPYPYYYGDSGETELTFTKNITLSGSEDTAQYNTLIGKINISAGCNQCHVENIQMLGLEIDNTDCGFTANSIYVNAAEILVTNANYIRIINKESTQNQLIKIIKCNQFDIYNSDGLMIEQNSGTFTAVGCGFGWLSDSDFKPKDAYIFNAGICATFRECDFLFHLYDPNTWNSHRVINNANRPIAFFNSSIDDTIKSVRNVRYRPLNVEYTKEKGIVGNEFRIPANPDGSGQHSIFGKQNNGTSELHIRSQNENTFTDLIINDKGAYINDKRIAIAADYSLDEQFTGKYWIDGKKIYRKTISCGTLPNSTTKTVSHSISNIDTIIETYGFASDGKSQLVIPFASSTSGGNIMVYAGATHITLGTTSNRTILTITYITLEYTCTDR